MTDKPAGRPSSYTDDIANEICEHLATGKSLNSYCKQDGKPSISMVYRWMDKHESFREKYARAKEDGADSHADRINDVADELLDGTRTDSQAARVALDALKWTASKLKPRKYGDRLDLGNSDGQAFKIEIVK